VTSPAVPLGTDRFACAVSGLSTSEFSNAVRANGGTLLHPEQVMFALTTTCATHLPISFGVSKGSGGSAERARATLSGLRLGGRQDDMLFAHSLPSALTIKTVNQVRERLAHALTTGPPHHKTTSDGQAVLLWEDDAARDAMESLVRLVEEAMPLPSADSPDRRWMELANKKQKLKKKKTGGDVVALQPLRIPDDEVEVLVARISTGRRQLKQEDYKFECPDCGEGFYDWEACQAHYEMTCHLDVSESEAIEQAQDLSRPLRYQCLHCKAQFSDWDSCKAHLEMTGHLDWADEEVAMNLCIPCEASVY